MELTERRGSVVDKWTQVWHAGETHEAIRHKAIRAPEEVGSSIQIPSAAVFADILPILKVSTLNESVRLKQKQTLCIFLEFFSNLGKIEDPLS